MCLRNAVHGPKRTRPANAVDLMLETCSNGDADVDMQAVGHVKVDMHIGPSVQGGANIERGLVMARVSQFLPITTPLHAAHLLSSSLVPDWKLPSHMCFRILCVRKKTYSRDIQDLLTMLPITLILPSKLKILSAISPSA